MYVPEGSIPLPDADLWAAAAHVQRLFGADGPRHIATRIGALACNNDAAGIATWKAIAHRLDQLMRSDHLPQ